MSAAGGSVAPDGLQLEVVAGKAARTTLSVTDRIVFGRHADAQGRLAGDPELSRRHAQISLGDTGEYVLEDLDSMNGTFVNGVRAHEPVVLKVGDIIDLGTTRLVARAIEGPAAVQAPASQPVDVRAATVVPPPGGPPPEPLSVADPPPAPPAPAPPAPALLQPAAIPPIELHLSIDVAGEEGTIALGSDGEPVRLRLEGGRWRIADAG